MMLGGPQGWCGRAAENLTFTGILSPDLEPVASFLDNIEMDVKE
jgi:hypothetical protein